jgi:hypothetical protein
MQRTAATPGAALPAGIAKRYSNLGGSHDMASRAYEGETGLAGHMDAPIALMTPTASGATPDCSKAPANGRVGTDLPARFDRAPPTVSERLDYTEAGFVVVEILNPALDFVRGAPV